MKKKQTKLMFNEGQLYCDKDKTKLDAHLLDQNKNRRNVGLIARFSVLYRRILHIILMNCLLNVSFTFCLGVIRMQLSPLSTSIAIYKDRFHCHARKKINWKPSSGRSQENEML